MARFTISYSGIEALEELRSRLAGASEEMAELSDALFNYVSGMEDSLGIYYGDILRMLSKVTKALQQAKEGDDGLDTLVNVRLPYQIAMIEELIREGLGEGDDEPPQKKLGRSR